MARFTPTLYLFGALIFFFTFTLLFLSVSFTSLCYHQVLTGYVAFCSSNPQSGKDLLQLSTRHNVAQDVCAPEKTTSKLQSDTVDFVKSTREIDSDLATVLLPRFSENISLNNISNSLFLYNAFYQSSELGNGQLKKSQLSIIGIALRVLYCPNEADTMAANEYKSIQLVLLCDFDSHHGSEQQTYASIECLPEGHNNRFTSVLIQCRVPDKVNPHHLTEIKLIQRNATSYKSEVSKPIEVITAKHAEESNYAGTKHPNYDITICVRPLFDTINVLNLLEFIAYYQTNGISNVVLYYYDFVNSTSNGSQASSTRAAVFLQFMTTMPGVHLHRFVLPHIVEQSVHSGAQIATIHDCLLRYPNSVQIHVDIDEFIFVQQPGFTVRQWIDVQQNKSTPHVALYIANMLHCHEFNQADSKYYEFQLAKCNSTTEEQHNTSKRLCRANELKNRFYQTLNSTTVKQALIVPNNAKCQRTVWPHEIRSKVIILQPRQVKHMGIHQVWRYSSDSVLDKGLFSGIKRQLFRMIRIKSRQSSNSTDHHQYYGHKNVDPTEAVLRHYRWCGGITQPYFFYLLQFYSVEDNVVQVKVSNRPNTLVAQFVLNQFRRFFKENAGI